MSFLKFFGDIMTNKNFDFDLKRIEQIINDCNFDNEKLDNKNDRIIELIKLTTLEQYLNKVLKQNDNIKSISFRYHDYFCAISEKNKYPYYILDLSYEYTDNCTLKYCKDLTYLISKYCKSVSFNVSFDYDSTIDRPIFELSIQKD